jgi:hypothetical protein
MRAALVLAILALVGTAQAATRRYAVVVANSTSLDPKVTALEYADDDAARYTEMLDQVADEVRLLTVLDASSQRVYPKLAARAGVPDKKSLTAALTETFANAKRDRDAGHEVIFYFVLIGHGDVAPGGEGYVSLLDAPFRRADLYREVLARSPATTNHVIIDACNSYFLVHRRGGPDGVDDAGPSRAAAVKAYVGELDLSKFPNTGVLLSTSTAKESHEWSAIEAGVFSHEVRSALTGGADANGDGRVDYPEVQAFIAAANLHIEDARARVNMFASAPAIDRTRPLFDLGQARFPTFVTVAAGKPLRFYLEDDRGVRYGDMHASGERPVHLALVPRPHYFVRTADGKLERRIDGSRPGRVSVDGKSLGAPSVAARGAVEDSFRRNLFAEAYGLTFYKGFAAANNLPPAVSPAAAWVPVDARGQLGRRLRALNERARADAALRSRLEHAGSRLASLLATGDLAAAGRLLDETERPPR